MKAHTDVPVAPTLEQPAPLIIATRRLVARQRIFYTQGPRGRVQHSACTYEEIPYDEIPHDDNRDDLPSLLVRLDNQRRSIESLHARIHVLLAEVVRLENRWLCSDCGDWFDDSDLTQENVYGDRYCASCHAQDGATP